MDTRHILLEIYTVLGGPEWKDSTNWNTSTPLNTWFGVLVSENDALLELNLESNNLEGTLPDAIGFCSSLRRLNMRGNKITGPIPETVGRCGNLKDLGLSRNILTGCIPESLGRCANLEYIGLSNNRLIDNIPESLGRCPNLREVSLGHNKLSGRIPEAMGRCSGLVTLSLSHNQLSGPLPECLEKWVNLQKLLLDNNNFNGPLPGTIGGCVNLRQLSIADNELSGFFPEAIGQCVNLRRLNLSGNCLSGLIPEGLTGCKHLDHLYLNGNRLAGYETLRRLTRLKVLDLDLVALLDLPPELAGQEVQVILSYLRELYMAAAAQGEVEEDGGSITVKRVKMMVVGPGEAGKTTLVHRLIEGKFEGGFSMTDGVSMTDLIVEDLKISLWDFSGQSVYMNTHSLFFSARTIFMIVWNPRQHENESLLYVYFHTVRNCAPDAPIILVSTHAKDTSKMADGTLDSFDRRFGRKAGMGPIMCYHHIDSSNGLGIQELKKDLVRVALQQPYVVQRIPRSFKKLEDGMKELAKHGRFSVTSSELIKYATDLFKLEEDAAHTALGLFHDWGTVHVLAEGDVILEPQKLSQVVACAISYKADVVYRMGDGKLGLIRHDEVDIIWKDYDEALRQQFLHMFHEYRLAYPLFDSHGASLEASIVPAMLPEEPLGGGHLPSEDDLKSLFFPRNCRMQASVRLEFEYLPVALLPKLQVRLSALATLGGAWKYGCALQLESFCKFSEKTISQSFAIVRAHPTLNSMDIYCGGDTTAARSVALRALVALRNEAFKGLDFVDVKVFYRGEPLASMKLIERKLKKDPNAFIVYEGDDEDVAVPLRGLAFLFADRNEGPDVQIRAAKTRLIHEEMLTMAAVKEGAVSNSASALSKRSHARVPSATKETTPSVSTSRQTGRRKFSADVGPEDADGVDGTDKEGGEEALMNGALSIVDLLKKKENRLLGDSKKKKKKRNDEWVDYRQVIPQSLLHLKEAALRAQANPEELDEFIDLERQFEACIPDILLFGCNIPSDLVEVHTLWVAYGDGSRLMALSPPERPTKEWEVVNYCTLSVKPRDDRSTLPGINKQVSDIVLLVLEVLSVCCALPPKDPHLVKATAVAALTTASTAPALSVSDVPGGGNSSTPAHMNLSGILAATGMGPMLAEESTLTLPDNSTSTYAVESGTSGGRAGSPPQGMRRQASSINTNSLLDVTFSPIAPWIGLVDMSSFIDDLRRVELRYFDKVENAEGRKIWVAKTVAARIHAPNMSVSDQVFRELFRGMRGANPHATLLRDAIDNITPTSVGIQERFDIFISHAASALTIPFVEAICAHLRHMGLLVWCDSKRKNGINKAMMTAIDNSSLFLCVVTPEYMDMVAEGEGERKRLSELVKERGGGRRDRDRAKEEKAVEFTCELQLYYARRRKHPTRIVPILTDESAAEGWRTVDMNALEVQVDYGEDGGYDLDDDEKEELRVAAMQKAYQKELNRVKRNAGWKGTAGQILAEQPAQRQLVVSMEAYHKAQRVVAQLEAEQKERERQELKRQLKREKAERKASAAQQSAAVRRLNSRGTSRGVEGVDSPAPGTTGSKLATTEEGSTSAGEARQAQSAALDEDGSSVSVATGAAESTEGGIAPVVLQHPSVVPARPPPLPYPPDCNFMQQMERLHKTVSRLLLEFASPSSTPGRSFATDDATAAVAVPTNSSLNARGLTPLVELSVQEVQFLLTHLHLSAYLEEFREREVNGLTLSFCEDVADVEEIGLRLRAKARELIHHLKGFKLANGVPHRLLQPPQQHMLPSASAPCDVGKSQSRSRPPSAAQSSASSRPS